jgi:hypothetical protein
MEMEPLTDRYRGKPGFLGWLVLKWDVAYLRWFAWRAKREWERYREGRP